MEEEEPTKNGKKNLLSLLLFWKTDNGRSQENLATKH